MDFSLLIGWVIAFGLVIWGIVGSGSLGNFWDISSVLITIGGTIATLVAAFPFRFFAQIPTHFKILLAKEKHDPVQYIDIITEISQEARKKGLLALEDKIQQYEDPFLRDCVMLVVDAVEPEKVKVLLQGELDSIEERHMEAWRFYDRATALGPAFGMIGTLVGLINMLKNLNIEGGAGDLGQSMSVALITTFYGSMIANVIFMPMAVKLREKHAEEMMCKNLIVEGVISIQAGENPRHIYDKLMSSLSRKRREKESAKKAAG